MFRVGLDLSALDPDFKEHANRGIGRYVRALKDSLQNSTSLGLTPSVTESKSDKSAKSIYSSFQPLNSNQLPESDKFYNSQKQVSNFSVKTDNGIIVDSFSYRDFASSTALETLIKFLPAGKQTLRQQVLYPLQLKQVTSKHDFQLLHFPAHMDAPAWSKVPYIVTVLDLIPLVLRDLYEREGGGVRFRLARYLELKAIRGASLILAISECTAKDIERLLGVKPERIRVTPMGVDQDLFNNNRLNIQSNTDSARPYLSYVGGIDARKNIFQLVKIFSELLKSLRDSNLSLPKLKIAGKIERDINYPQLLALISDLGLKEDIELLGYLSDEELKNFLIKSKLFVFPSLYEGFGLPPLECLALGVPVLSAKNSCLPEVLGNGAHWFEPSNISESVKILKHLLTDNELLHSLKDDGYKQAAKFSWNNTARLTMQAYEEFNNHKV